MNHALACPDEAPARPVARFWHALAARWAGHLENARQKHAYDFTAGMNVETLRDIGAPDRIIAAELARRDFQQLQLSDLRQWRDG